jgi:hypothetical protein
MLGSWIWNRRHIPVIISNSYKLGQYIPFRIIFVPFYLFLNSEGPGSVSVKQGACRLNNQKLVFSVSAVICTFVGTATLNGVYLTAYQSIWRINSLLQGSSWKETRLSATQVTSWFFTISDVYYRVHDNITFTELINTPPSLETCKVKVKLSP